MAQRQRPQLDYAAIRAEAIAEMIGLGFSDEEAAAEARRTEIRARARADYVRGLIDRLKAANEALEAAWMRWLDENPDWEEHDEPAPDPPEQAAVDAIFEEIDAIIAHDRWPQHLHFRDV
ncbi:MAG TPA: hypothetical protein VD887_10380 [Allosphingosinicella sp.]|nr:hypothetical protein [Allosphingosinicella sp.]